MIDVTINGEKKTVETGLTVGQLLTALCIRGQTLMVERNKDLLKREQFDEVEIENGDVLELIRLTGGG